MTVLFQCRPRLSASRSLSLLPRPIGHRSNSSNVRVLLSYLVTRDMRSHDTTRGHEHAARLRKKLYSRVYKSGFVSDPSWYVQTCKKKRTIGCVNSRVTTQRPEGAMRRDSRSLAFASSCISVNVYVNITSRWR